jgi:hypothetical protein
MGNVRLSGWSFVQELSFDCQLEAASRDLEAEKAGTAPACEGIELCILFTLATSAMGELNKRRGGELRHEAILAAPNLAKWRRL